MTTIITKIYKVLRGFFVGGQRYEILSNESLCEGLTESYFERLLAKRYEKRFLVTIFEREDEDDDEDDDEEGEDEGNIGELIISFYEYFLVCKIGRLEIREEIVRLLQLLSYDPESFFDKTFRKGEETFVEFFTMIEEEGCGKDMEKEEFFKYFLGFYLESFFDLEKVGMLKRIRIRNFLIRRIVSGVIDRQNDPYFYDMRWERI